MMEVVRYLGTFFIGPLLVSKAEQHLLQVFRFPLSLQVCTCCTNSFGPRFLKKLITASEGQHEEGAPVRAQGSGTVVKRKPSKEHQTSPSANGFASRTSVARDVGAPLIPRIGELDLDTNRR